MAKLNRDTNTGLYYETNAELGIIKEQTSYITLFELLKNKVVLDLGGNIGCFAYNAIKYKAKKVISYEPSPRNVKLYNKQGIERAKVIEAAVSDKNGIANFYINKKNNKGLHSLIERRGRECIEVKTISIQDIINKVKPDYIKVDIEGGEYFILKELVKIDEYGIKGIAIEFHMLKKPGMLSKAKKFVKVLNKKGYKNINGFEFKDEYLDSRSDTITMILAKQGDK